jgi:spore maturation protein CgeB
MRMLYFGPLEWGATSLHRLEGIRPWVEHLYALDQRIFIDEYVTRSFWIRLQLRLGYGPLLKRVAAGLVREARRYQPEVLWIEQGVCISAATLRRIKESTGAFCVHYTPDSLKSPGLGSVRFQRAMPYFDLCITTKEHEIKLYQQSGAQRVLLSSSSYNPLIMRPHLLDAADRARYSCDVAFAGDWGVDRARSLCALVDRGPVRLHLYGRKWDKGITGRKLAPFFKGWVYGQEYAKALCGAKICLAFLNRRVEDTYTTRSLEIPACGAFMLAERTDTHLALFQEDVEAAFFDSDAEMIDKVNFYLQHEEIRQRVARAGYEKVKRAFPGWESEMKKCLAVIERQRAGELPGSKV